MTGSGDLLGTLRYMSPEQAQARHDLVDYRSDIYSLGLTLYELLTLTPAFAGADRGQLLSQILTADPVTPRQVERTIPRDLETAILKCLEKDPARRYPSAGELAADLNRFLARQPVLAKRPTVLDRATKWTNRHRGMVWVGVAVLAVTAAVATAAAAAVWREKGAKEQALQEKTDALTDKEQALADKTAALADKTAALADKTAAGERADRHLQSALVAALAVLKNAEQFASLRQVEEATRALDDVIALFSAVAADHPIRVADRVELAQACRWIADGFLRSGWFQQALSLYQKHQAMWVAIRTDFPTYDSGFVGSPPTLWAIAMAHTPCGMCHAGLGHLSEAEAAYRDALAALDELQTKSLPARGWRYDLERGRVYVLLGRIASDRRNIPQAQEAFRNALEMARRVQVREPRMALTIFYQAHVGRGELLWSIGETAGAKSAYQEAFAVEGAHWPRLLATCPVAELRDPEKALARARALASGQEPFAENWSALAAAFARAGKRKEAELAVARSECSFPAELFLLAILCQNEGDARAASEWYARGVKRMAECKPHDLEGRRLRTEAAEALGILAPHPRELPVP